MKNILKKLHGDSLFRNSFYLMLATAVMAGFGFFFWLISARLAPPESIGIATTLISVMSIISIFSLVGFDSVIVRYLLHSTKRNEKLNTGIILVALISFVLSSLFVFFIHTFSPQLSFIRESPTLSLFFVVFCIMAAVNVLTDSVFLAYRQTKYSLIINTIFSLIKMLLPLLFARYGAFGIFSSAALGQSIGFVLSITVMIWKFGYRPRWTIDLDVIKEIWKYSTGNYIAGVLNLLPVTLLPLIITNHLGAKEAAYYYIVMMIGNLLYVIPQATTKSLFAEGSNDELSLRVNIRKSIWVIMLLLVPATAVLLLGGGFILEFFGKSYSTGGVAFLNLIAISGLAVSFYSILGSLFKVRKNIRALIISNLIYAVTIIVLSYLLLSMGLLGIGIAWLLGNLAASITGFYFLYRKRSPHTVPLY